MKVNQNRSINLVNKLKNTSEFKKVQLYEGKDGLFFDYKQITFTLLHVDKGDKTIITLYAYGELLDELETVKRGNSISVSKLKQHVKQIYEYLKDNTNL